MEKPKAKPKTKTQNDSANKTTTTTTTGKKGLGQKSKASPSPATSTSSSSASSSNQKKMKSKNSKSSCASSKQGKQRGKTTASSESSSKRSKGSSTNKCQANKSQEQTKKSKPSKQTGKASDGQKKVSPSTGHHHNQKQHSNKKQTTPKSAKTKNQRTLKSKENRSEKTSTETMMEGTGSSEFNSAREIPQSDSNKTQDFYSSSSKSQEAPTLKTKSAPPRSTCKTTKTMKQKIKSKIAPPMKESTPPPPPPSIAEDSEQQPEELETSYQTAEEHPSASSPQSEVTTGPATETGTSEGRSNEDQYEWVPDSDGSNANEAESPEQSSGSDENIESTKPTINQQIKTKKERPLNDSDTIGKIEFESLNDEINELNSGIQMLKHSYGGIIKSLMVMQKRRMKKKLPKQKSVDEEVKLSFLTTLSTIDPKVLMKTSCMSSSDKYTMERFVNPLTREEAFQELFDEVDELNQITEKLRSCYDKKGNFLRDVYEENECNLDRKQFNELKTWVKKLGSIVDEIARNYNDDLLTMFRLN